MTKEQAVKFFSLLYRGRHHIPGEIKKWGPGWQVNHPGELASYDFDDLTRLVFLAHDYCARASVQSSGPGMIRVVIHQRDCRTGATHDRHPTIEDALTTWRKKNDGI